MPTVAEDVGIVAPGFFESISQHRQTVENSLVVDAFG
jgi:hypothetical protein